MSAAPPTSAAPALEVGALGVAGTGSDRVRQLVSDYVELTKPKVQSLLLLTTITTMYVAGDPSPLLVFLTCLGGYLSAGGAGAVNHWFDRDIDLQMARTASRPIPAGRVAPRNAEFDLFVIQQPNKPFGVSWYQTDVNANGHGVGSASVRGIFDRETFSVSPGGTTTFGPTHQYHLGLWFNNPKVPFALGCEPGKPAPVVTPFNGEQHAGIQALNTAEFPVNAGPLSRVSR